MSINNIVLTDAVCSNVEAEADRIDECSERIKKIVDFLESSINNPDIKAWVSDTEVGKKTLETIRDNNQALIALVGALGHVSNSTRNLSRTSRRINSTNG